MVTTQQLKFVPKFNCLNQNHIKGYEVLYMRSDQSSKTDSFGRNRSKQLTLWRQNRIPGVMCRETLFK